MTATAEQLWRAFTRGWFLMMRPTDAQWSADWYRDPGSAWWER